MTPQSNAWWWRLDILVQCTQVLMNWEEQPLLTLRCTVMKYATFGLAIDKFHRRKSTWSNGSTVKNQSKDYHSPRSSCGSPNSVLVMLCCCEDYEELEGMETQEVSTLSSGQWNQWTCSHLSISPSTTTALGYFILWQQTWQRYAEYDNSDNNLTDNHVKTTQLEEMTKQHSKPYQWL
jgi:hypothetical protein